MDYSIASRYRALAGGGRGRGSPEEAAEPQHTQYKMYHYCTIKLEHVPARRAVLDSSACTVRAARTANSVAVPTHSVDAIIMDGREEVLNYRRTSV